MPGFIENIICRIEASGFEAWAVGGCVRDWLLSKKPSDYDICTSALPGDIMRIFAKTVPTGARYGTVTVLDGGGRAEVTTFRRESAYGDSRRPDSVSFEGGIRDDLSRRDFTVNAMAYHPRRGIFDPFDGQADLNAGSIRAVGRPEDRFREDALRILRAYRFAAQLGFDIEPATEKAANENMSLVSLLSGERIRAELEKLLMSSRPSVIFKPSGLFEALGFGSAEYDCPERLDRTQSTPAVRWSGFLYLSGIDEQALFGRLKFDKATMREVHQLVGCLYSEIPTDSASIKKALGRMGPGLFRLSLGLFEVLKNKNTAETERLLEQLLSRGEPYRLDMLAVNGADLAAAGYPAGVETGKLLHRLLEYVIEHPEENSKEKLLNIISKN